MQKYNVIYEDQNEQIDYGLIEANTETDAIEEIVKNDEYRKNISDPLRRYYGMKAIMVVENNDLENMQEMEKNIKTVESNFIELQKKYYKTIEELRDIKTSIKFGATFEYKNHTPVFIPIFATIDSLDKNGEKPIKFSLNFDQKLFAQWTVECTKLLKNNK